MINRIYIGAALLLAIIVIGFFSVKSATGANDTMLKVESLPLHNALGWGYEILVDHKIFIHQECIPAMAGKKEFLTKEDALKTAGLVIQKLMRGKQPSITKNDLDSLKISF